jgi:hypothetical protein
MTVFILTDKRPMLRELEIELLEHKIRYERLQELPMGVFGNCLITRKSWLDNCSLYINNVRKQIQRLDK